MKIKELTDEEMDIFNNKSAIVSFGERCGKHGITLEFEDKTVIGITPEIKWDMLRLSWIQKTAKVPEIKG